MKIHQILLAACGLLAASTASAIPAASYPACFKVTSGQADRLWVVARDNNDPLDAIGSPTHSAVRVYEYHVANWTTSYKYTVQDVFSGVGLGSLGGSSPDVVYFGGVRGFFASSGKVTAGYIRNASYSPDSANWELWVSEGSDPFQVSQMSKVPCPTSPN